MCHRRRGVPELGVLLSLKEENASNKEQDYPVHRVSEDDFLQEGGIGLH